MSELVVAYTNLRAFVDEALPFLLQDEARHNLQLGITDRMLRDPEMKPSFLATLRTPSGETAGVASLNPGHCLVLSSGSHGAIQALCDAIQEQGVAPHCVFGPSEVAELFARTWCSPRGLRWRTTTRMGVFVLYHLQPPRLPEGIVINATVEHLPLLVDWAQRFHAELSLRATPPASERIKMHIESGNVFLWMTPLNEPVSVAMIGRESPRGSTINLVYTPDHLRGQGFAGACVARACRVALARGKQFCTLYADLDNSTSTGLYKRLGFELLVTSTDIALES